jgi:hypothetical protein
MIKRSLSSAVLLVGQVLPLVVGLLAGAGCSSDTNPGSGGTTLEGPVRLNWFHTSLTGGDPAAAPNPHEVKQAVASDGVNFTDAVTIFSANDLVDPDVFPLVDGSGFGLLYTATNQVKYAFSTTVDGTYSEVGGVVTSGGQSATITSGGALLSFITGVSSFPLTASASGASITGSVSPAVVISASTLGYPSGIVGDPTVIELSDGSFRAYVKYAEAGAQPFSHAIWTVTSSDLQNWGNPTLVREASSVPGAIRVGDQVALYFVDFSGELSESGSLGVGISEDGGATFEFTSVQLDGEAITGAYDPAPMAAE